MSKLPASGRLKQAKAPRLRRSILVIQTEWENGKCEELEDLMLAWKGVKEKDPSDPHSFFKIAGFHGAPFRGPGITNIAYWGGYCHHGNVLFPLWHRPYLLAIEDALRTIKPNVTLPFLDETDDYSRTQGLPWCLTRKKFCFHDGTEIDNPLYSFVLPIPIQDKTTGAGPSHSKPAGYETVRYPLSGLVGTPADKAQSDAHNAKYTNLEENERLLNENYRTFLNSAVTIGGNTFNAGAYSDYVSTLDAPNYTVFSNTTSAGDYNSLHSTAFVNCESPHNMIHLSIGGRAGGAITGANGDMSENDTAGLDPIFFFHHCYVDYLFWQWQKIHEATVPTSPSFVIDYSLRGTNSSDHPQGPTPGIPDNTMLTLDTPLLPFKVPGTERYFTGRDCINIYAMGFCYDKGSLASSVPQIPCIPKNFGPTGKIIEIRGIDRSKIPGSFAIDVFVTNADNSQTKLATKGVLSRWNTSGCMNCQASLEAVAQVVLPAVYDENKVSVRVSTFKNVVTCATKDQPLPPDTTPPGFDNFKFSIILPKQ